MDEVTWTSVTDDDEYIFPSYFSENELMVVDDTNETDEELKLLDEIKKCRQSIMAHLTIMQHETEKIKDAEERLRIIKKHKIPQVSIVESGIVRPASTIQGGSSTIQQNLRAQLLASKKVDNSQNSQNSPNNKQPTVSFLPSLDYTPYYSEGGFLIGDSHKGISIAEVSPKMIELVPKYYVGHEQLPFYVKKVRSLFKVPLDIEVQQIQLKCVNNNALPLVELANCTPDQTNIVSVALPYTSYQKGFYSGSLLQFVLLVTTRRGDTLSSPIFFIDSQFGYSKKKT